MLAKKMGWGLNDDEEDERGEGQFLDTPLPKVEEKQEQEQEQEHKREHEHEQTVVGGNASAIASSETLPSRCRTMVATRRTQR